MESASEVESRVQPTPEGRRSPRGYRGIHHETIGSDLLALGDALYALTSSPLAVFHLLGERSSKRLGEIEADAWYPIGWLLDIMESVEAGLGRYGLLRMGRTVFKRSHEARVLTWSPTGQELLLGLDEMYHQANRGEDIGGWSVQLMRKGLARLEKTTPHLCYADEGILSEALKAVGCPSLVTQSRCLRDGADSCLFEVHSMSRGGNW